MDFAISMRPDYYHAVIDTISYYGWKNIIYLYSSHEGKSLFPIFAWKSVKPQKPGFAFAKFKDGNSKSIHADIFPIRPQLHKTIHAC